uniref:Uncharacterized protein n=1 Tax=Triticum urartu TaxID=4572 RepID=A0A8R7V3V3_TRIUA
GGNARAGPSFQPSNSERLSNHTRTIKPAHALRPLPLNRRRVSTFLSISLTLPLRRRRSVLPATPMASKWVRPEVSSTPRSGPSARSCHSLFFRSLIYPVSRPRRCTRCSRRRAWPSASAPLASFATSPATQKSGKDLDCLQSPPPPIPGRLFLD